MARYEGAPALHRAAWRGDLDAIDRALAAGTTVDALHQVAYRSAATPLMYAASAGRAEAVRRLLAAGASPNPPAPSFDHAPLDEAARGGSVEVLEALRAAGVDPAILFYGDGDIPIAEYAAVMAARAGATEAFEWLIERYPEECLPPVEGRYIFPEALHAAARSRDGRMIEIALAAHERRLGSREALCADLEGIWPVLIGHTTAHGQLQHLRRLLEFCPTPKGFSGALAVAAKGAPRDCLLELIRFGDYSSADLEQTIESVIDRGMTDLLPLLLQRAEEIAPRSVDLSY